MALRIVAFLALALGASGAEDVLPAIAAGLGHARVKTGNSVLEVTTGKVSRRWKWTGGGLVTISFRDEKRAVHVGADGTAPFEIAQAAGYRFFQYTHSKNEKHSAD